jgi:hypothetical protein
MTISDVYMLLGFMLAAWAVVGNDSIQTLGTFLASNSKIRWYYLFLATAAVMILTLTVGWYINDGDFSWGRLAKIDPPKVFTLWHVLAPLTLLFLTRYGLPVSTTFLVLSVFASGKVMTAMVFQSLLGYSIAFVTAFVLWKVVSYWLDEKQPMENEQARNWRVGQWFATMFLWSQWLIHDMANISVYLPREMSVGWLLFALLVLTIFLGVIFRSHGGSIQKIVLSKTSTKFVRSATIIDLVFACTLLVFKQTFALPLSTTWVFVGLLAGRELAIHHPYRENQHRQIIFPMLVKDFLKISAGLAISILIALLVARYN